MNSATTPGNTHTLTIKGSGGQYVIGSITPEAAAFWQQEGNEKLSEYVKKPASAAKVDPAFELKLWRNNCDLLDRKGISSVEELSVEDAQGNVILEKGGDELAAHIIGDDDDDVDELSYEKAIAVRSREKGTLSYSLSIDGNFDAAKLKLHQIDLLDEEIITTVSYDGVVLDQQEWFSKHYADVEAEILG